MSDNNGSPKRKFMTSSQRGQLPKLLERRIGNQVLPLSQFVENYQTAAGPDDLLNFKDDDASKEKSLQEDNEEIYLADQDKKKDEIQALRFNIINKKQSSTNTNSSQIGVQSGKSPIVKQVLFGIEEKVHEEKNAEKFNSHKKIKFWDLPLRKKLNILQVTMQYRQFKLVIILLGTLICVASLFYWNAYVCGVISKQQLYQLINLDLLVAIAFIIELLHNFFVQRNLILNSETLLTIILIVVLISQYLRPSFSNIFSFLNILKALRIYKLREISSLLHRNIDILIFRVSQSDLHQHKEELFDEDTVLSKFIINSIIDTLCGILVESAIFIALDEYSKHEGYQIINRSPLPMTYIQAIYFTIVTFSTIGYGDIYPIKWYTKMAHVAILLINITVLSNFFGRTLEFIYKTSPYYVQYRFQKHVVIVGQIDQLTLIDLLEEIQKNDEIMRKKAHITDQEAGIKILIVNHQEPSDMMREVAFYYMEYIGNEIAFLKDDVYDFSRKWYKFANLKKARVLICFSSEITGNVDEIRGDIKTSLVASKAKEKLSKLRVILVMNAKNKERTTKDPLYRGIEIICPSQLNDYVIGSSIINHGFGTVLQHLLTMRSKSISSEFLEISQADKFMLGYINSMQQEIYSFKAPPFFVGMEFVEAALLLYLYGVKLNDTEINTGRLIQDNQLDNRRMTLIAVETQSQTTNLLTNNKVTESIIFQKGQSIILDENIPNVDLSLINGVQQDGNETMQSKKKLFSSKKSTNMNMSKSFQPRKQGSQKSKFLINPEDYTIQEGDSLYVICDDYEVVKEAFLITDRTTAFYKNFSINLISLQTKIMRDHNMRRALNTMISKTEDDYKSQFQTTEEWQKDQNEDNTYIILEKQQLGREQILDDTKLRDHLIIFGDLQRFQHIMEVVREYSERNAFLYCEADLDVFKWKELTSRFQNIYYVKGQYLLLEHLKKIRVKSAFQITILSDMGKVPFSDAVGICLSRILVEHFDRTSYLIELRDENKITFLHKDPKYKAIGCPSLFSPAFVTGNVHFSNMIGGVLAHMVFTPDWLDFFQEIATPSIQGPDELPQNKTIHFLQVTGEIAYLYKFYGVLQVALMQHRPRGICIGLVKQAFGSKYQEHKIDQFLTEKFCERVTNLIKKIQDRGPRKMSELGDDEKVQRSIRQQIYGTLKKFIGDRYVFTNPSFYTAIEDCDGVLVLGQSVQQAKGESFNVSSRSPQSVQNYTKREIDFLSKLKQMDFANDAEKRIQMKKKLIVGIENKLEFLAEFSKEFKGVI